MCSPALPSRSEPRLKRTKAGLRRYIESAKACARCKLRIHMHGGESIACGADVLDNNGDALLQGRNCTSSNRMGRRLVKPRPSNRNPVVLLLLCTPFLDSYAPSVSHGYLTASLPRCLAALLRSHASAAQNRPPLCECPAPLKVTPTTWDAKRLRWLRGCADRLLQGYRPSWKVLRLVTPSSTGTNSSATPSSKSAVDAWLGDVTPP